MCPLLDGVAMFISTKHHASVVTGLADILLEWAACREACMGWHVAAAVLHVVGVATCLWVAKLCYGNVIMDGAMLVAAGKHEGCHAYLQHQLSKVSVRRRRMERE